MLGTYQEDPANSGEFPAFVKDNKHLYFLKVSTRLLKFSRNNLTICLLQDPLHHFEGWTISDDLSSVSKNTVLKFRFHNFQVGSVTNVDSAACAEKAGR